MSVHLCSPSWHWGLCHLPRRHWAQDGANRQSLLVTSLRSVPARQTCSRGCMLMARPPKETESSNLNVNLMRQTKTKISSIHKDQAPTRSYAVLSQLCKFKDILRCVRCNLTTPLLFKKRRALPCLQPHGREELQGRCQHLFGTPRLGRRKRGCSGRSWIFIVSGIGHLLWWRAEQGASHHGGPGPGHLSPPHRVSERRSLKTKSADQTVLGNWNLRGHKGTGTFKEALPRLLWRWDPRR